MRRKQWVLGAGLVLHIGAIPRAEALPVQTGAPAASPVVFDSVTVVDVATGKLLPDQRVVIAGNRIRAVGAAGGVEIPTGAVVVKAAGKYLIPGLWDMHVHPHDYAPDIFHPLLIANGVTGIRDAGSSAPLEAQLKWRREILAGTRAGAPRQLLSGNLGISDMTGDTAAVRREVDSLHAAGANIIKTYMFMSSSASAVYFAVLREARRLGLPVGGHVHVFSAEALTQIQASDSGATIFDHVAAGAPMDTVCVGERPFEPCGALASAFRRNGGWTVPTLAAAALGKCDASARPPAEAPTQKPPVVARLHAVADRLRSGVGVDRNWLRGVDGAVGDFSGGHGAGYLALAHRADLPILAGTDAGAGCFKLLASIIVIPPGFSLHAELAMYVSGGLTPLAALQTATLNPAKFLHGTDSLGTVAPGKLADLVLLDASPLADITNTTTIRAVVANGRYFDRAALDQLTVRGSTAVKAVIEAQIKAAERDRAEKARDP